MYGYIYITKIPTSDGDKFYIGQKKGAVVKESYWGSGVKVKDWFKKHTGHHPKCCEKAIAESYGVKRKILGWAKNRECLCSMEKIYVSLLLGNDICWNMNIGGLGGSIKGRHLKKGRVLTEEHKQKLRIAQLGRKASPELRRKYSIMRTGELNSRYGVKWTEEEKIKHSERMKEYWKTHIPSRLKHKLKQKDEK